MAPCDAYACCLQQASNCRLALAPSTLFPRCMCPATFCRRRYTQFDARVLYSTLNVTHMLLPGCNALGIVLGTGWYGLESQPWCVAGSTSRHSAAAPSVSRREVWLVLQGARACTQWLTCTAMAGIPLENGAMRSCSWLSLSRTGRSGRSPAIQTGPALKAPCSPMTSTAAGRCCRCGRHMRPRRRF